MPRRRTADTPCRRGVSLLWGAALGALLATGALTAFWLTPDSTGTALVGYGDSGTPATPASGAAHTVPDASDHEPGRSFSITGGVGGLFPGKTSALVLTVSNPDRVTIKVTSITTTVSNASLHCGGGNVEVTPFSGHLVVPPRKAGKATLLVTLVHTAPDTCQGTQFQFTYRGLATAG